MTEVKKDVEKKDVVRRQIIIETDGNTVSLTKAEVSGKIELLGILNMLITHINSNK